MVTFGVMDKKKPFERIVNVTPEFNEFLVSLDAKTLAKVLQVIQLIKSIRIVSKKLVKKLKNTIFYELRIQVGNEYRIIVFSIDHNNFMESQEIVLLYGFLKKGTKDYKKATKRAENILTVYLDEIQRQLEDEIPLTDESE